MAPLRGASAVERIGERAEEPAAISAKRAAVHERERPRFRRCQLLQQRPDVRTLHQIRHGRMHGQGRLQLLTAKGDRPRRRPDGCWTGVRGLVSARMR
jgi:hypothetical protein